MISAIHDGTSHDDSNATPQGKHRIAICGARSCGMFALPDGAEARDAISPAHRAPLQVLVQDPPICVDTNATPIKTLSVPDQGNMRAHEPVGTRIAGVIRGCHADAGE